jgi:hypothetical protein
MQWQQLDLMWLDLTWVLDLSQTWQLALQLRVRLEVWLEVQLELTPWLDLTKVAKFEPCKRRSMFLCILSHSLYLPK